MSLRILVVDDHEGWTRHVSTRLQNDLRYRVIGEAADGPEAVLAAETLKPDLMLLDIGLPTLNGIEVAQRILATAPHTRILFLTEQRSPEVAEAALRTGAFGYVVKSDAGRELLPAIDGIAEGRPFVSARLRERVVPSLAVRPQQAIHHHDVLFSADETFLIEEYARFVEEALRAGGSAIVFATAPRLTMVRDRVETAFGVNVAEVVAQGRYLPFDMEEVASAILVDGRLDETRFASMSAD